MTGHPEYEAEVLPTRPRCCIGLEDYLILCYLTEEGRYSKPKRNMFIVFVTVHETYYKTCIGHENNLPPKEVIF